MTTASAQRVVVGSLLAVGALDVVAAASRGPGDVAASGVEAIRNGFGLAVAGLVLSAMAGPAPAVAAGFALLLLVQSLYTTGLTAVNSIGKALS